jgi:hypothetical protein
MRASRLLSILATPRARARLTNFGDRGHEVPRNKRALTSPYVQSGTRIEHEADATGGRRASNPVGSPRQACVDLLRFGVEIEVLAPPEPRAKMARLSAGLNAIYERRAATI